MRRNIELIEESGRKYLKDYEVEKSFIYTLEEISPEISKLTIHIKEIPTSPIRVIFDGNYMFWYGDWGIFGFECTWKASIYNLPYFSPDYMWEKLDRGCIKKEFIRSKEKILKTLTVGTFYKSLNKKQREDLLNWVKGGCGVYPKSLLKFEDSLELEELENLVSASEDEYEWVMAVRELDTEACYSLFKEEPNSLFDFGYKVPENFYFIFYLLNLVAEDLTGGIK